MLETSFAGVVILVGRFFVREGKKSQGTAVFRALTLFTVRAEPRRSNSHRAMLALYWYEFFEHRGAHEIRRQQALAQDEVVKLLLIELAAQRRLGFLA